MHRSQESSKAPLVSYIVAFRGCGLWDHKSNQILILPALTLVKKKKKKKKKLSIILNLLKQKKKKKKKKNKRV
jgi:hypothetical protein